MSSMRAAKARKRQADIAAGLIEREPRMERWYRFQYGVRDKSTGEEHWRDLKSVRQMKTAVGLILKHI
jgi:hypothetical protein